MGKLFFVLFFGIVFLTGCGDDQLRQDIDKLLALEHERSELALIRQAREERTIALNVPEEVEVIPVVHVVPARFDLKIDWYSDGQVSPKEFAHGVAQLDKARRADVRTALLLKKSSADSDKFYREGKDSIDGLQAEVQKEEEQK